MATTFDILVRLRAATVAFAKDVSSAFADAERKGAKAADSIGRRFAKATSKAAGRAFQAGSAGLAGAFGFGVRDALAFEQSLDNIEIQSAATADEMAAFRAAVRETSEATGIGKTELGKAGETLVNLLGPVGRNAKLLDLLGRTAVASGADVGELAGLISAVSDSFGIAVDDVEGMEQALSAFLSTGKQGKVPLNEMNQVLQEVAANFAEMSSGGTNAAADVSAALQVARTAFGTAGQAGTGLKAGATALKTHADKVEKAIRKIGRKQGIDELKRFTVWADDTKEKLKDFRELAPAIARMNLDQLTESMGSSEAAKFWAAFKGEGFQNFLDMADPAREATDVVEDFGKRTKTEGFRMAQSWNRMKLAIADAITPEVLERFVRAVEGLAGAVEFVSRNLGGVLTGLVAIKALQMATNFSDTAKAASKAADAVGDLGGQSGGALKNMSKLQAVAAGASAFFGGLSAGQIIGTEVVEAKKSNFKRQKKRQKRALSETERATEATQRLVEAGLIDEQGRLTTQAEQLQRTGAAKKLAGKELTPEEQDVLTAVSGFEVAKKAEVRGGLSGLADVVTDPFRPDRTERRSLVTSEQTAMTTALQAQADATRMLIEELRANTQATRESKPNGKAAGGVGDMGSR